MKKNRRILMKKIRHSYLTFFCLVSKSEWLKIEEAAISCGIDPYGAIQMERDDLPFFVCYTRRELRIIYRMQHYAPTLSTVIKIYEASRVHPTDIPQYFEFWEDLSDGFGREYDLTKYMKVTPDELISLLNEGV